LKEGSSKIITNNNSTINSSNNSININIPNKPTSNLSEGGYTTSTSTSTKNEINRSTTKFINKFNELPKKFLLKN